jgi:5-formyltetrahydrofolate cyclo-ligase
MTNSKKSVAPSKDSLRRHASAVRREAHRHLADKAGQSIAKAFLETIPWIPGQRIAGYWPLAEEADVCPLLEILVERGCLVALPVVVAKDRPLLFRQWRPGLPLEKGRHGTSHPFEDCPSLKPDLLLMPLLAFDRQGGRLGYGGGYYDRTLASLRAEKPVLAVGIAYSAQEMPELPFEPHDQRLDWIVTEITAREALS